jgi:Alternative complex III, ActD subunit
MAPALDFTGSGPIYGLMAEFDSAQELVAAAHKTHAEGYRKIDAYSPFPIEGLAEAIGFHKNRVSLVVLIGGLIGLISAYSLQYWVAVITYPTNIGGRPYHSWPSFIIVTFELTILFGGVSSAVGMLALNGLPLPYHPVFNVPEFAQATDNKFFLVVESTDPIFDAAGTRSFLSGLAPRMITEVPS